MARYTLGRRRAVRLSWYVLSAGYSVLYILVFGSLAGPYGLSIWWLAVVELTATVPYTLGVARVVEALVDRRPQLAVRWSLVAGAGYFAPDVFILTATRHLPAWLVAGVLCWATATTTVALHSLRGRIRARRQTRAAYRPVLAREDPATVVTEQ